LPVILGVGLALDDVAQAVGDNRPRGAVETIGTCVSDLERIVLVDATVGVDYEDAIGV